MISPKDWKLTSVDGEEIYLEKGIEIPSIEKIKKLRKLTRTIVEVMGCNPETVNICVAKEVTDGYNEKGQLFFNANRSDSPYRWFGVVARELGYNVSHMYYAHVKAMVYLITKGLENIEKIYPRITHVK